MSDTGDAVLTTDRLLLRRWRVADAALQRELWTERDPRVPPHRRIDADGHPSIAELEESIRRDDPDPTIGLLVIVPNDAAEPVGYCGLIANARGQDREPEIAYELLRRAWHRGYATEAARAVLDWARASGHRRLWSTVRNWNTPSHRVMQRLGFVQTERVELDPTYGDTLYYTKAL
jgi:RimJ/RimL family protein N-acetyltransferase